MNTQLINQISSILTYLHQSASIMSEDDLRSSASNVYHTISNLFMNDSAQIDINSLSDLLSREDFDISSFCSTAQALLLEYCCHTYTEDMSSLSQNYTLLQSKYKTFEAQLNNLTEITLCLRYVRSAYHKKYEVDSPMFKGRGVVYTVITGGYDNILEPLSTEDCLDYVLITDVAPSNYHGKWQVRVIDNPQNLSSPLLYRWAKTHPFELFPDYDYSIFLDGKLQLAEEKLTDFIRQYRKTSSMICMHHNCSNNIESEANAIVRNKKATRSELDMQIARYRSEGFVDDILVDAAFLLRDHHDPLLKKVMEDWWTEICTYNHHRDQMSFGYVCWKNNYNFDINDLIVVLNPWCVAKVVH
ncbi:glycosyltransferase domain-containing protein [Butyrivibrio sp. MC2021]|uniref:glycosyltransferase domain-containing protein n=1 Tax=Butyrivibrio sp. MC2021 TaxID=1408306 RepID=UPI000478C41F|nr:glycosyltransferase domain-containing protein [Butyrivibrio sp. MC2021]